MKKLIKKYMIFFIITAIVMSALPLKTAAYDSIRLNETSIVLRVSQTFKLEAAVTPEGETVFLAWKSDNEAVAKVDKTGVVTAVSSGEANISVTVVDNPDINDNPDEIVIPLGETEDTSNIVCKVTVEKTEVKGISLNRDKLSLRYKSSAYLTAALTPENADNKTVVWSSSDPGKVSVDSNGKVTGTGRGTAVITAQSFDGGYTAICRVTVKYSFWQWLIVIFLGGWIWY
ncbi:MAG: Ig-like domain-containing protein [Clostridiales bacterium]|nr:Ig-like domain-containing protein [Clostridiales bacterium]